MSEIVTYEDKDTYCIITLNNGKVNAISPQLIIELTAHLETAQAANQVVILTGKEGIFSGGYDLKTIQEGPEQATALVKAGSTLTLKMLSFPLPIIIACNGHAIAKGIFLLLACDYRIGTEGDFKLGLNEVLIGMTVHNAGIELAKARLAPVYFERCVNNAEMFDPKSAITAGFLDTVVPAEALLPTAEKVAAMFTQLNLKAHGATKLKTRAPYLASLKAAIESDAKGLSM